MTKCKPELEISLEIDLFNRYGPMIGGNDLRAVLGFPSMEALRQALSRGKLPVAVFKLPRRRGNFALVKDVAKWLAQCRAEAVLPVSQKTEIYR